MNELLLSFELGEVDGIQPTNAYYNNEEPSTIIDTLISLPINYFRSLVGHLLLVKKFFIIFIHVKPLSFRKIFKGNKN